MRRICIPWLASLFGLLLTAQADRVVFRCSTNAQAVALAGEFSGWSAEPMVRGENGAWSAERELPQGIHAYKFVIDGAWTLDAGNPIRKEVDGAENSAVVVGTPSGLDQFPARREVSFVYTNTAASSVFWAGEFNLWNSTETPFVRDTDGVWRLTVALPVGTYQTYKLVVDGQWMQDPGCADFDDSEGTMNSLVAVPWIAPPTPTRFLPRVFYHDPAQRVYPVEAARVLAWLRVQKGEDLGEIDYDAATDTNETTHWTIRWHNGAGTVVRERQIEYPAELLLGGATFYRTVLRDLAGKDWRLPATPDSQIANAYWQGADAAGLSRMEGVRAALTLSNQERINTPDKAARLAGLLAHAALPGVSGPLTLDDYLLARGAAWLAIAEQRSASRADALWVPVLFLSGREQAARDAASALAGLSGRAGWWSLLAGQPSVEDAFRYALRAEQRDSAPAFLTYLAQLYPSDIKALAASLRILYPDRAYLDRLHDLAPLFRYRAGVGGGHLYGERWPVVARRDWIQTVAALTPLSDDFLSYTDALQRAQQEPEENEEQDGSLLGLAEASDLINLGYREGWGSLGPVAVASARDLLNFGWEMSGQQIGARHYFVRHMWGVYDLAKEIQNTWRTNLLGVNNFFYDLKEPQPLVHDEPLRMEAFMRKSVLAEYFFRMGDPAQPRKERVADYSRFNWLRRQGIEEELAAPACLHDWDTQAALAQRLENEAGRLSRVELLAALWDNPRWENTAALVEQTAHSLPDGDYRLALKNFAREKYRTDIEYAREFERTFWRKPGNADYAAIFRAYLRANAPAAAKRFYELAKNTVSDSVAFGNSIGGQRFTLALVENNEADMRRILAETSTGSARDMIHNMCYRASQEDYDALKEEIDGALERYGGRDNSNGMEMKLLNFLPLIPALGDAANPKHEEALDYFKNERRWPTMQWILLHNAKLGTEDAIRFLGGRDTDEERRFQVYYLLGDRAGFENLYADYSRRANWSNMSFVLVHNLRAKLLELPEEPDDPSVRPPNAQSLVEIVQEAALPQNSRW